MLKLILGAKGIGKTKVLLDTANAEAKVADGVVIYLDKNSKHMFELDRNIRLVNVFEYPVPSCDILIGFVCGLIAGNSDIQTIYFDSFMTLANISGKELADDALNKLSVLAKELNVNFVISLSISKEELSEEFREYVVCEL